MLLTVNHNTSGTSGEWIRCAKLIAWASELGSCQSNFMLFMRLWAVAKYKDSLKACFENVNISKYLLLKDTTSVITAYELGHK